MITIKKIRQKYDEGQELFRRATVKILLDRIAELEDQQVNLPRGKTVDMSALPRVES